MSTLSKKRSTPSLALRSSPLSRAQLREIDLECQPLFVETRGDRDKKSSLRPLEKTDFFTREIDQMVLSGEARLALHSAKDLPDPLPKGLHLAALTKGQDPSDSLVAKKLFPHMRIGTSSLRREEACRKLCPTATFVDIRGTIEERLALDLDGVVIAEAALLRLGLNPNRYTLPGKTAPLQGQLAIVTREDDYEMRLYVAHLDSRKMHRRLNLGLRPTDFHYPIIRIEKRPTPIFDAECAIVTSQSIDLPLHHKMIIAVGKKTAQKYPNAHIADPETAEGVIALLERLKPKSVFYPRSSLSRPLITDYLQKRAIPFEAPIAYDTYPNKPYELHNLDCMDEILFTSPSTVDAYIELFGPLPTDKILTPIGPVTAKTLNNRRAL